jgi:hypothetical protein
MVVLILLAYWAVQLLILSASIGGSKAVIRDSTCSCLYPCSSVVSLLFSLGALGGSILVLSSAFICVYPRLIFLFLLLAEK